MIQNVMPLDTVKSILETEPAHNGKTALIRLMYTWASILQVELKILVI
jgi:hypothetical protein